MQHNQQENRRPGDKRDNAERARHDREADAAGTNRHDSRSDPAKFDEDLPYEQQAPRDIEGEEARGKRLDEGNPARRREDNARSHDGTGDLPHDEKSGG